MARHKEAPYGFECPYRHKCPHLGISAVYGGIGVSPEISKYALPVTAFMPFAIIGAFPLNATCQIAPSYRTSVSSPCPAT